MKRAVCPGSFDPITFGHLDIIERASLQFDEVIVAVFVNRNKSGLFSIEERIQMIGENVKKFSNVRVDSGSGLSPPWFQQTLIPPSKHEQENHDDHGFD
jgi:pantetheine-phosphate adenylyltransferase